MKEKQQLLHVQIFYSLPSLLLENNFAASLRLSEKFAEKRDGKKYRPDTSL